MNISIILVDKTGSLKQQNVRGLTKDIIYKKCGFRKNIDFELRHAWKVNNFSCSYVELWAKNTGKAGQENKYDLPPPIDSTLYFGTMAIIGLDSDKNPVNILMEEWKKIYEHLFGGFEDLDEDTSESEDELKDVPKNLKTKTGYLKDGFIVEDKDFDNDSIDFGSELEEEEYYYSENE